MAGFASHHVVYNSPAADVSTCLRVLEGGGTVVVDSTMMLTALADALAGRSLNPQANLLVRVNPRVAASYEREESYQELTAHADPHGKFGVAAEALPVLLDRIRLPIHGLHAHVGTQMDHVGAYEVLAEELHRLLGDVRLSQGRRPILDLGGGLGIPFVEGQSFPSIEAIGPCLAAFARLDVEYWMEPGHSLVGNAVGLLTKVVAKKEIRGRTWAIVDTGTDQLAKVTLLAWPHQVRGPDGATLPTTGPDALGGPLCFSGDTLLSTTRVDSLAIGDPVLVQHTGAYCFSLANAFNGRSYGGMVLVRVDGTTVRVDDRQTPSQHLALATHRWGAEEASFENPKDLDLEWVNELGSSYLQMTLQEDSFRYLVLQQVGPRSWRFEIQVSSAVGFVSMPFALRAAGDSSIIAVLLSLGLTEKTFPVWGVNASVTMSEQLPSSAPFAMYVDLSHPMHGRQPGDHELVARWRVEGREVMGHFDLKFTVPQSIGDPPAQAS